MDQISNSLSPEDSRRILCSYVNATSILQIVRVTNISNWYFERVMFPGQCLLFEAPRLAQLEIHTAEIPSAILADKISCTRLQVRVGTEKSSATKPKHARGDYQYFVQFTRRK